MSFGYIKLVGVTNKKRIYDVRRRSLKGKKGSLITDLELSKKQK